MLPFTTRRVVGTTLTCLTLVLLAAQPAGATATWLSPADLSEAGQTAGSPQVAIDGQGGITAAWSRADGGNYEAQAAFRPAGGSWQTPVTLSEAGYDAGDVQVAADWAGEVVAVWDTFPPASVRTIQAAVKSPLSGSWSTPVTLATIGESVGDPQIAIDSRGNAIAVWEGAAKPWLSVYSGLRQAGGWDMVRACGYLRRPRRKRPSYCHGRSRRRDRDLARF